MTPSNSKLLLFRLAAPYLAVIIFWCGFQNAWLAILAYHAQILFWNRGAGFRAFRNSSPVKWYLLALASVMGGPIVYWLMPFMAKVGLHEWISAHGLSQVSFMLMIPYFGILHPFLEQLHWDPLRLRTRWSHFVFAGYHMLVLSSLLTPLWLLFCFVVLTGASVMWHWMTDQSGTLKPAALSHVLADLGIVLAAWVML